jgi:hypothetical protein
VALEASITHSAEIARKETDDAYGESALDCAVGKITATGTIRKEINRLCKQPYTRALAWCLYVHADHPRMLAEDLFGWLDEIGAGSPQRRKTWNEYHRGFRDQSQKLVSKSRNLLRKNGLPCND